MSTWRDLLRLLRRSRHSDKVTILPSTAYVLTAQKQKLLDTIRVSDSIFTSSKITITEELALSDEVSFFTSLLLQQVGDNVYVSDSVAYQLLRFLRLSVSDNVALSDDVSHTLRTISLLQMTASDGINLSELLKALTFAKTPADSVSLSESVSYTLQTSQPSGYIIPDSYVVYNHNWQTISADLSVWWDNNLQTQYTIYYTPSVPANPRWVFFYFNTPISLPRQIEIYIPNFTPYKSLYIYAYFYGEWVSSATVTLSSSGWYSVTLSPVGGGVFDELSISTDEIVVGAVSISEFHILASE